MQQIKALIKERDLRYAKHPFIQFLQDTSIDPYKRLSFLPHTMFFVMSFADINRFLLRDEGSSDPIQQMMNTHGEEDGKHWAWSLRDLTIMGYDPELRYTQSIKALWSNKTIATRRFCYDIVHICLSSPPILKLVMVEAIEAMGKVALEPTVAVTQEIGYNEKLLYLGQHHLDREIGHAIGSDEKDIEQIVIPDELRPRAMAIVNRLYDGMEAFNTDILNIVLAENDFKKFGEKAA